MAGDVATSKGSNAPFGERVAAPFASDSVPVPMTSTHDDTGPPDEASENRAESDHGDASENDRVGTPQYVSLDLEDEEIVIYDPNNHRAWIQSDLAVETTAAL